MSICPDVLTALLDAPEHCGHRTSDIEVGARDEYLSTSKDFDKLFPFMLQLTLEHVGIFSLSPWPLLRQLILIVLLPFIIGMISKRIIRIPPRNIVLRYLPSTCVIATVWMSMSASSETLKELNPSLLALIALSAACIHAVLILLCWLSRLLYRSQREEWLALLFTASQKTLPVAVGVLTFLHQPAGLALVACILFHFMQLFADSLLASRFARRPR